MTRPGWAAVAAVLALLVVGGYLGWRSFGPGRAPPIRVGTILPLSGPESGVGIAMKNSMQLAIDEVNRQGGVQGRRVELVAVDELADAEPLMAAAQRLTDDPTVLAASAHLNDDAPTATDDVFRVGELANLIPGSIDWQLFDGRRPPQVFRLIPDNRRVARQTLSYAQEKLGLHRFHLFHDATGPAVKLVNPFREALRPPSTVQVEAVQRELEDFESYSKIARAVGADQVVFAGAPKLGAVFLARLRANGVTVPFHLATKYPPIEFIELAKGVAEGTTATFPGLLPEDTAAGRAFLAAYAAAGWKEPPGLFGLHAYAAMQVLLAAIERSALTRKSVVSALYAGQFESALGPIQLQREGQLHQPKIAVYQVRGGRWVPIFVTDDEGHLQPFH